MNFVGSACLQLGYLAGTVPSFLIIAARQSRRERPQPVRPFLYAVRLTAFPLVAQRSL